MAGTGKDAAMGPGGAGGADQDRKTRKIRMSDREREVLISTLKEQVAAATDASQRGVLEALLGQITPKKRPTTQRYRPVFSVRWKEDGVEKDCGHEHTAHLQATDCASQHTARGLDAQVIPTTRPVDAG